MDKILEVKKLKIAFRTNSGTLKAVRDISFDLERGRTLAIVGESGSGKSVTSRAIMGILAGNAIVEGGEIFYDGKDLLRIAEEDMHKLRGDKISMIFQDPLSSLNPIVKIGKQITEAMLLKNKTGRAEAKKEFNALLALLKKNMLAAMGDGEKANIDSMCKTFNSFYVEGLQLENAYNNAQAVAQELASALADFLFLAGKKQNVDVRGMLKDAGEKIRRVKAPLLTARYEAKLTEISQQLTVLKAEYKKPAKGVEFRLPENIEKCLTELNGTLDQIMQQTRPDFIAIGYYKMKNPSADLTKEQMESLNAQAGQMLEAEFMKDFRTCAVKALEYSCREATKKKEALLPVLREAMEFYRSDFSHKEGKAKCRKLAAQVDDSIDRMEIIKDSAAYTFESSLSGAIDKYFLCCVRNPKEENRYARQSRRREAMIARGKHVTWKVVPKNVYDLNELREGISLSVSRLLERYEAAVAGYSAIDFQARAEQLLDAFRAKGSQFVYRVTKAMAKEMAIKLMEEVGIHEPRTRYYQYPFEFSGGMRQRIVIAIALAANPDILICDEPTTALDVTIQAQILELIQDLKKRRNLSVIFITHDLGVVANIADDIAVMYAGKIVEYGTAEDIFYDPRHPYTWALLSSMPDLDTKEKLDAIPGTPPNMIYPPKGDAFAERNKYAMEIDFEQQPPMFDVSETHRAATWLLHPDAPKVEIPKIITERIERMQSKNAEEDGGVQA